MSENHWTDHALFRYGVMLFGGMLFGAMFATWRINSEAIRHGVAEYVIVDAATGKTEFRWKSADAMLKAKEAK